jgi:hypothetical protein
VREREDAETAREGGSEQASKRRTPALLGWRFLLHLTASVPAEC